MPTCNEHSGFEARIKSVEDNVKSLWNRWDWIQKIVLGVFITLSLNLIGVIALIVRTYIK
jgi:hypothetical protein